MDKKWPFGCISSNGIDWVNDIEVQVVLFERGWEAGHCEPDTVRSFSLHLECLWLIYFIC
jgi:hypothetical protein